jgi:hypothetical protein
MQEEVYTLDGKTNGMMATYKGTNNIIELPKHAYRNKQLLESELYRSNIKRYDIWIKIDNNYYPLSIFQEITPGIYQAFTGNMIKSVIPINSEYLIKSGYFSFLGDPEERINNYKDGIEINKKVFRAIREATSYMYRCAKFKQIEQDKNIAYMGDNDKIAPFKHTVYDSSLNFRIMRTFEFIRVNEVRKSCNDHLIPFYGKFDKFKNVYFCFCRDKHEFKNEYYEDSISDILNEILNYINTNYPELEAKIIDLPIKYQIML